MSCGLKSCDSANYSGVLLGNGKLSVWTNVKVRECYNEVGQEDGDRQSTVQEMLRKNTDFLGRIIVPVAKQDRWHFVVRLPSLLRIPPTWWVFSGHGKKTNALSIFSVFLTTCLFINSPVCPRFFLCLGLSMGLSLLWFIHVHAGHPLPAVSCSQCSTSAVTVFDRPSGRVATFLPFLSTHGVPRP